MIAFSRKNLSCLIWTPNSFVCKSHVSLSPFLQLLSTSRETELVKNSTVYDVLLHKYQFSAELASIVASDLSRYTSAKISYSTLSFLKESGFSSTQLQKLVKQKPRLLTASVEDDIKLKIKIFQDLGLSSEDIAKVVSGNKVILDLSASKRIIPSLSLLKGLLGSNHDVVRVLRGSSWFLSKNLNRNLLPNIEFLRSCGIDGKGIRLLLCYYPRCSFIKADAMRRSVDKANEMGISRTSGLFVYAVGVIASKSSAAWELKWQAFRDLGFSESDLLAMFKKAPNVFDISLEKAEKIIELLLATGKFTLSSIVYCPRSLMCGIERRYKPRLRVLATLESRHLITKWPSLGTVCTATDDQFYKSYIGPYLEELGEEFARESNAKGKGRSIKTSEYQLL